MTQNVSILHTVCTINGHRCEGWANAADALSLPDIQLANSERGPDGLKLVSSTGMRGGIVTFKFLANSRSRAQFGKWLAEIQRGAVIVFEGSISNSQTGESTRLTRGNMEVGPAGTTLGNAIPAAREFQIDFEEIISNYDGFKTQSAPVLSTATSPAVG